MGNGMFLVRDPIMQKRVSVGDPDMIRALAGNPNLVNAKFNECEPDGHLYKKGDVCVLKGLTSFPEFNGTKVTIAGLRVRGEYGLSYYIEGDFAKYCNWTYEARLQLDEPPDMNWADNPPMG